MSVAVSSDGSDDRRRRKGPRAQLSRLVVAPGSLTAFAPRLFNISACQRCCRGVPKARTAPRIARRAIFRQLLPCVHNDRQLRIRAARLFRPLCSSCAPAGSGSCRVEIPNASDPLSIRPLQVVVPVQLPTSVVRLVPPSDRLLMTYLEGFDQVRIPTPPPQPSSPGPPRRR